MIFVQFKEEYTKFDNDKNCFTNAKYLEDGIGSDSVFILDGRNSLENQINDAHERIDKLKHVENYKYFEIRCGSISCSNLIYKNYKG